MRMKAWQARGGRGWVKAMLAAFALAGAWSTARAVDMTLYNSAALLDSNGVTPLQGTSSGGDIVQVILAGANGSNDVPGVDGNPGGDDTMLGVLNNPTFVGAGLTSTNTGFLVRSSLVYSNSLVGSVIYVRFWNYSAMVGATHYGDSALTNLPAGDAFGLAELDFVPTASHPRTTNKAFTAIPTLTEWGVIILVALVVGAGARKILRNHAAVAA